MSEVHSVYVYLRMSCYVSSLWIYILPEFASKASPWSVINQARHVAHQSLLSVTWLYVHADRETEREPHSRQRSRQCVWGIFTNTSQWVSKNRTEEQSRQPHGQPAKAVSDCPCLTFICSAHGCCRACEIQLKTHTNISFSLWLSLLLALSLDSYTLVHICKSYVQEKFFLNLFSDCLHSPGRKPWKCHH